MSEVRIRLSPPESTPPQPGAMPVENAQRWVSPHEKAGLRPPLAVFVTQSAYLRAEVHAASEPDYEVGGVLVGKYCTDSETASQFIVVTAALPARFTRRGNVYLTFTQDTLVDLHATIDELFLGKKIVGWYHTHPSMGVFLSHYDTWLHKNFFPEPWQVALVIEPHTSTGGFFIRQADGELDPRQYYGFYELDGNFSHSIVHWNNLERISEEIEPAAIDAKGETHHE